MRNDSPTSFPVLFRGIPLALTVLFALVTTAQAQDKLPDLIVDATAMQTHTIDAEHLPGQVLLRFNSSLPNIGAGDFLLEATGEDGGNGRQTVNQRVQQSDGGSYLRDAGTFLYNPAIGMMEAEGWVAYNLREVLANDGVGDVLATGAKPAVRITSSATYDSTLPGVPSFGFQANGGNHGISVGWTDIYFQTLELQWIDVTGLDSGTYWLEIEVDPTNHILESNEENNVGRIKVDLDIPKPDCGSDNVHVGETGEFITRFHDVSGTARIIDNCTIQIDNFNFDGTGIDVRLYGFADAFLSNGVSLSDNLLRDTPYVDETLIITLPDGTDLDTIGVLSIWCIPAQANFGEAVLIAATGGEGEGEGEDTPAEVAQTLLNSFAALDTDNDGTLSFSEASEGIPALSGVNFNGLDENGDGQLTQSELNAVVGTTNGFGCIALVESRFEEYFGDIVLLILAALTLVSYSPIAQSGFGK